MARVLVTGGSGFVGANLVAALLKRGDTVRILRRKSSVSKSIEAFDCEKIVGDILDPLTVSKAVQGCDTVFHLASVVAYWRAKKDVVYRINVEGTRTVMAACLQHRVNRVVHTSTIAAIGIPKSGELATEQTPFDPRSSQMAYADSKRLGEIEVRQAIARGLNAVIVNPAQVMGPGDHGMYMGNIFKSSLRGTFMAVPIGGLCVVDAHAVVLGLMSAADKGRCGERYILGGENLSYMEIAQTLANIVGKKPPRYIVPNWVLKPTAMVVDAFNHVTKIPATICGEHVRLGAEFLYYDSSKAQAELDFPILPFSDAAQRAYDWYRANGYITKINKKSGI